MPDQEYEPDLEIALRRPPASLGSGDWDNTDTYEVICCKCGDDPALDYTEVSARLRQIRGPYPFMVGLTVFFKHGELHDTAEEPTASRRHGLTSPGKDRMSRSISSRLLRLRSAMNDRLRRGKQAPLVLLNLRYAQMAPSSSEPSLLGLDDRAG
jgi:hypothetical protein